MKMKQICGIAVCGLILLLCGSISTFGQDTYRRDTILVNKLLKDSRDSAEIDIRRAIVIAQNAVDISEKIGYEEGVAKALLRTGGLNDNMGKNAKAIGILEQALKISRENHFGNVEAKVLNTLGSALARKGDNKAALSHFIEALNMHRQLNDSNGMAVSYTNIGASFMDQDNFEEAVKNYDKAVVLYRSVKALSKSKKLANLYTNIGNVYAAHLDSKKGLGYLYQAIYILNELHDSAALSVPFSILAAWFENDKKFDSSLYYHEKAIEITRRQGDKKMEALECANIAGLYMDIGKYSLAQKYYDKALPIARQISYDDLIYGVQKGLAETYAKEHDYKKAAEYYDSAYANRDSYWKRQKEKDVAEMTARYNNNELENKNALLKKENDIKQIRLQRKNILIYSGFGVAILIFVIGLQVVRHNKLIANQKLLEVEQKQLLAKMNPHFIFNCLNSIQQYVVQNDAYNANKYLADFAMLMRQTLDNSKDGIIPLQREIDYLENYLSLESMRFENKFSYKISCSEGINKNTLEIPSMIIQPFVENAIHHGLRNLEHENGALNICFYINGAHLFCEVDDNGIGMDEAMRLKEQRFIQYQSHGMELTRQRLELVSKMSGNEYDITVVNKKNSRQEASGTTIIIKFPVKA